LIRFFLVPALGVTRLRRKKGKDNCADERDKRAENRFFEHGSLASETSG
jgi:hypothetical protein